MKTFVFEIFDGNPNENGPCGWGEDETTGRDIKAVARRVLREARAQVRGHPDYAKGDVLYAIVRDPDGYDAQTSIVCGWGFGLRKC